MNIADKIIEELRKSAKIGEMQGETLRLDRAEQIIRKYLNDESRGKCSRRKWYQMGYEDSEKNLEKTRCRMNKNPANQIKDTMWTFLMDHGQKSNIPALKEYVYDLIKMTTQKDAGQRKAKGNISWDELNMMLMSIVIEATALVLSGDLDQDKSAEGWVPVDERLPEDGEKVLAWYEYFRYGEYNRMYETYGISWQYDGHWSGDVSGTKAKCIAWRPLPETYCGKE